MSTLYLTTFSKLKNTLYNYIGFSGKWKINLLSNRIDKFWNSGYSFLIKIKISYSMY